jgi:hypothetical protein
VVHPANRAAPYGGAVNPGTFGCGSSTPDIINRNPILG